VSNLARPIRPRDQVLAALGGVGLGASTVGMWPLMLYIGVMHNSFTSGAGLIIQFLYLGAHLVASILFVRYLSVKWVSLPVAALTSIPASLEAILLTDHLFPYGMQLSRPELYTLALIVSVSLQWILYNLVTRKTPPTRSSPCHACGCDGGTG